MKRAISLFLLLVMPFSIIASIGISAFSQTSPTVYSDMNSSTVNAGETIKVPISIKDNTGLMGWMLTFNYDTDYLSPVSVEYGDVISGGIQDNIEGNSVPGRFNVYWASSGNETYSGVMFYINFTVAEYAVGTTQIDINYSQADTFDEDFNDVVLVCDDISINVENTLYDSYAKIAATDCNIIAGDDFLVKLNIYEINNIDSVNIELSYDAENFDFISVTAEDVNLTSQNSNGCIELSIGNITDALENTDFVIISFKCKDNAFSGTYNFDITSEDSGIICYGSTITVQKSANSEIAEISIPDNIVAEKGEQITIPLNISNNHGIMGYRLHIEYNPDELEIVSATNSNAFAGTFNDSIGNKTGEFDLLWNTTEDVVLDATLFNLTFNVITQETVTSDIIISYSQEDTFNESYDDVVFNCQNGSVLLCYEHIYAAQVVAPSCIESGYTVYTCSNCGNSYKSDYTDAVGHMYKYINTDANGEIEYSCEYCGDYAIQSAEEIYVMWDVKYVNKAPNRTAIDNSSYLDIVNDNIINAKDFAIINKLKKIFVEAY